MSDVRRHAGRDAGTGLQEVMVRVLVLCSLLLVAGCALGGGHSDPRPIPAAWTGEVVGVGDADVDGFATVTVLPDGETIANLTLRSGGDGARHPWSLKTGRCGGGAEPTGSMVGVADVYPPLEPDERGNASGTASLAMPLDREEEFHVEVRESPDDETVLGCGDLVLSG